MRQEIARGAAWMVLFRLIDRSIGLISTMMLARLLVPADFGLVAMAMSVIAFIELATAFSFEIALIQKPDPDRTHFDSAWTLNVLIAAGGAVVTLLLAWPAAAFYGDPRLVAVMLVIGGAWLVSGFENIGIVYFRREMNFAAEFRLMASKRLIAFAVTLAIALWLRSYWALVIGTAVSRAVGVALSYAMHGYRPRFSLARARELFSFSGWMLINNIAGVLLGKLPHLIVGRQFGAQPLGAYTVGSELANLPHTELVAPINRALFPGYSRLLDDMPAFRKTCVDATAAILLIVLPASVAVALLAGPIVRVLLGAQWQHAVPVIEVLALSGAISAITANAMSVYMALGRPSLYTGILLTRLVLLAAMVAALSGRYGMLGVAYAELVASAGSLLVSLHTLLRTIDLPVRQYAVHLWRPVVASGSAAAVVHAAIGLIGPHDSIENAFLGLLVGLAVGALIYPTAVWALWVASGRPDGAERLLAQRIAQAIQPDQPA